MLYLASKHFLRIAIGIQQAVKTFRLLAPRND